MRFSHATLLTVVMQATLYTMVDTAKQQVTLSDSYLPVAMQIIAHLTDQMTYEQKVEPPKVTSKPATSKPQRPSSAPSKPSKPASPNRPASKPSTPRPYVTHSLFNSFLPLGGGWVMSYQTDLSNDITTPFHRPGLYAPVAPPKQGERILDSHGFLLPMSQNSQYTVIGPLERRTEEPLLDIVNTEIKPLVEPKPEKEHLLPPNFPESRTAEDSFLDDDELNDENLQYLSDNVRELIKKANDPDDDSLMQELRAAEVAPSGKAKLSGTNLRLQLLYDLLSREAKKKRLSDYSGYSPTVMNELINSAGGGARAQLSFVLSKMVDRRDCDHEYANNRAREMVTELAKDDSTMSSEIRYLQPLAYYL